eukprot:TRINITY_DN2023_c0_g1_i2.p3 TRINITY_DN2023_c0_g1~~TRINITY_DN2023_c0_g1_i2.p3  ORF type:complete len:148 (-),score=55.77 TRINITY_DN2023_c0_g1_i2:493-936(-)
MRQKKLASAKCVKKKNTPRLLFMDGFFWGSIVVPDELHTEFLEAYYKDCIYENKHFIVEKCTPVFRFFVDIDHLGKTRGLSEAEICRITRILQGEVKSFYPELPATEADDSEADSSSKADRSSVADGSSVAVSSSSSSSKASKKQLS